MNLDIYSVLNMLSDPSRLRIITLLYNRELTVGQICEVLELSQANTSKHLKKLLDMGMVNNQQDSRYVYYYINPIYKNSCKILKPIVETFSTHKQGEHDLKRLEAIKR